MSYAIYITDMRWYVVVRCGMVWRGSVVSAVDRSMVLGEARWCMVALDGIGLCGLPGCGGRCYDVRSNACYCAGYCRMDARWRDEEGVQVRMLNGGVVLYALWCIGCS